jgi:hypothetical protein
MTGTGPTSVLLTKGPVAVDLTAPDGPTQLIRRAIECTEGDSGPPLAPSSLAKLSM